MNGEPVGGSTGYTRTKSSLRPATAWIRRRFTRAVAAAVLFMAAAAAGVIGVYGYVSKQSEPHLFSAGDVPETDAVLVLGAFVHPQYGLSVMLRDRLLTALDVHKAKPGGRAPKLLVSGDHGRTDYDEVNPMKKFLLENGLRDEDVFMDHAGFSTYDSLYRAKEVFQVHRVTIVTQEFHLKRAVYIARQLGLEAYGVASDRRRYPDLLRYEARELLARNKDFVFVHLLKPKPTFLGEAIPITGDGRLTNDKPF